VRDRCEIESPPADARKGNWAGLESGPWPLSSRRRGRSSGWRRECCTDRQLRALVLLEQGLRYRRVAESMGITSATAYEHVEAGMRTVYRHLHA
jgi:DNA-binding CsgD family transcriptional regulator